ncbi:MAG: CHASE3 domain-containing protein [Promethearchaeota archaeon]
MIESSKKKMKLSTKIFIIMVIVGLIFIIVGAILTAMFWNIRSLMIVPVGLTLLMIGVILIVIVFFISLPRGCASCCGSVA